MRISEPLASAMKTGCGLFSKPGFVTLEPSLSVVTGATKGRISCRRPRFSPLLAAFRRI